MGKFDTEEVLTKHGKMLVIKDDPWVSRSLKLLGEYSEHELSFMQMIIHTISLAKRKKIDIVEAGAYIGDLTIPLSRMANKVYAFEPQTKVREILLKNLEMNGIENVEVFPYALGHANTPVFYTEGECEAGPGGQAMRVNGKPGDVEVEMRTLDSFNLDPDFIKADIEGAEVPFLVGSAETRQRTLCPLFMEFDTVMRPEGFMQLPEVLASMGYNIYKHMFYMYRVGNFNNCLKNPFDTTVSKMLLAVVNVE